MGNQGRPAVDLGDSMYMLEIEPRLAIYQFDNEEERIFMELADEDGALHPPSPSQDAERNIDRCLGQLIDSSVTRLNSSRKQTTSTTHSTSQSLQTSRYTDNQAGIDIDQLPSNNDPDYHEENNQTNFQVEHVAQSPPDTIHSSRSEVGFVDKIETDIRPIPRHGGSDNVVESTIEDNPSAISIFALSWDRFRISKPNRRLQNSVHETRSNPVPLGGDTSYLTEDTLFQLLISRNKKREEEAICAANAQKKLESAFAKLEEENGILRDEIRIYDAQFQRTELESNSYKSQITNCKSKLGKFRGLLSSLKTEFQILRDESINMKAIACSLNMEGNGLRTNVDDMKAQISQIASALNQKRSHRGEYEDIISALRHSLEESVRAKHDETEIMRHSLFEVKQTLEKTEVRASRNASEVVSLQQVVQETESRVREELSRASVISRDQSRVRFEQQLHGILREKAALETELSKTKDLLACSHQEQPNDHVSPEKIHNNQESLLEMKDQEIEALQNRVIEDTSRYNAQDLEMKRMKEVEIFNTTLRNQLERQLEALNQKVVSFEAELYSHEINSEQLRTLQKELDRSRDGASQKEKGLILTQEKLSIANTDISALELGKTKAKGEIHTLLLRLQESERWMKNIKGNMEKLGISVPTEPLEETWDKLEGLRRSNTFGELPNSIRKVISEETAITPSFQTMAADSFQRFARTESTYRTQSTPKSIDCTPESRKDFETEMPNSVVECVPNSQKPVNIVPFSSFQEQLSPTKYSSSKDTEDFENLFAELRTPPVYVAPAKCLKISQELSGKRKRSISSNSTAGKNANRGSFPSILGKLTSQDNAVKCQSLDDSDDKQKTVSFKNQNMQNIEVGGKDINVTPRAQGRHGRSLSSERKPFRTTQRKYSKTKQFPMSHQSRCDDWHENMDQIQSPRSIVSGSGQKNSAREETKKRWVARGQKRPGRKTRGERYSTKFSQAGCDSR